MTLSNAMMEIKNGWEAINRLTYSSQTKPKSDLFHQITLADHENGLSEYNTEQLLACKQFCTSERLLKRIIN